AVRGAGLLGADDERVARAVEHDRGGDAFVLRVDGVADGLERVVSRRGAHVHRDRLVASALDRDGSVRDEALVRRDERGAFHLVRCGESEDLHPEDAGVGAGAGGGVEEAAWVTVAILPRNVTSAEREWRASENAVSLESRSPSALTRFWSVACWFWSRTSGWRSALRIASTRAWVSMPLARPPKLIGPMSIERPPESELLVEQDPEQLPDLRDEVQVLLGRNLADDLGRVRVVRHDLHDDAPGGLVEREDRAAIPQVDLAADRLQVGQDVGGGFAVLDGLEARLAGL